MYKIIKYLNYYETQEVVNFHKNKKVLVGKLSIYTLQLTRQN